eukprot:SAG25_NODE_1505_length_2874_cov_1.683964_3_plen_99_part_00
MQKKTKWVKGAAKRRKAAEKKAQKEAKKSGRPNEWEGLVEKYIEPMPSDLLSPHELNRRKWLSDVPLVCPPPPPQPVAAHAADSTGIFGHATRGLVTK